MRSSISIVASALAIATGTNPVSAESEADQLSVALEQPNGPPARFYVNEPIAILVRLRNAGGLPAAVPVKLFRKHLNLPHVSFTVVDIDRCETMQYFTLARSISSHDGGVTWVAPGQDVPVFLKFGFDSSKRETILKETGRYRLTANVNLEENVVSSSNAILLDLTRRQDQREWTSTGISWEPFYEPMVLVSRQFKTELEALEESLLDPSLSHYQDQIRLALGELFLIRAAGPVEELRRGASSRCEELFGAIDSQTFSLRYRVDQCQRELQAFLQHQARRKK